MDRGELRVKIRHTLRQDEIDSESGELYCREITRRVLDSNPTLDEVVTVSMALADMKRKHGTIQVVNKSEKNNGKKNVYALTNSGRKKTQLEIRNDLYCHNCKKVVEEPVRKPTCPDCGTPVKWKKR